MKSLDRAQLRKAARFEALKRAFPLAAVQESSDKNREAPDTAPKGGGKPLVSNRRYDEAKKAGAAGRDGPAWPNDGSLAVNDTSHREAGLFGELFGEPNRGQIKETTPRNP